MHIFDLEMIHDKQYIVIRSKMGEFQGKLPPLVLWKGTDKNPRSSEAPHEVAQRSGWVGAVTHGAT